jgi:hypothetical protein
MSVVTHMYFKIALQQFENTVELQQAFIHLISTSTESRNGDDFTKTNRLSAFEFNPLTPNDV